MKKIWLLLFCVSLASNKSHIAAAQDSTHLQNKTNKQQEETFCLAKLYHSEKATVKNYYFISISLSEDDVKKEIQSFDNEHEFYSVACGQQAFNEDLFNHNVLKGNLGQITKDSFAPEVLFTEKQLTDFLTKLSKEKENKIKSPHKKLCQEKRPEEYKECIDKLKNNTSDKIILSKQDGKITQYTMNEYLQKQQKNDESSTLGHIIFNKIGLKKLGYVCFILVILYGLSTLSSSTEKKRRKKEESKHKADKEEKPNPVVQ